MPQDPVATPLDPMEDPAPSSSSAPSADTYVFGPSNTAVVYAIADTEILIPVQASLANVAVDPTVNTAVAVALVAINATPGEDDWQAATWQLYVDVGTTFYSAEFFAADLVVGEYDLWIQVTDGPLIVAEFCQRLDVR